MSLGGAVGANEHQGAATGAPLSGHVGGVGVELIELDAAACAASTDWQSTAYQFRERDRADPELWDKLRASAQACRGRTARRRSGLLAHPDDAEIVSAEHLVDMYVRQRNLCALCRKPMTVGPAKLPGQKSATCSYWSLSVDRVDASRLELPYWGAKGGPNARLVHTYCNALKSPEDAVSRAQAHLARIQRLIAHYDNHYHLAAPPPNPPPPNPPPPNPPPPNPPPSTAWPTAALSTAGHETAKHTSAHPAAAGHALRSVGQATVDTATVETATVETVEAATDDQARAVRELTVGLRAVVLFGRLVRAMIGGRLAYNTRLTSGPDAAASTDRRNPGGAPVHIEEHGAGGGGVNPSGGGGLGDGRSVLWKRCHATAGCDRWFVAAENFEWNESRLRSAQSTGPGAYGEIEAGWHYHSVCRECCMRRRQRRALAPQRIESSAVGEHVKAVLEAAIRTENSLAQARLVLDWVCATAPAAQAPASAGGTTANAAPAGGTTANAGVNGTAGVTAGGSAAVQVCAAVDGSSPSSTELRELTESAAIVGVAPIVDVSGAAARQWAAQRGDCPHCGMPLFQTKSDVEQAHGAAVRTVASDTDDVDGGPGMAAAVGDGGDPAKTIPSVTVPPRVDPWIRWSCSVGPDQQSAVVGCVGRTWRFVHSRCHASVIGLAFRRAELGLTCQRLAKQLRRAQDRALANLESSHGHSYEAPPLWVRGELREQARAVAVQATELLSWIWVEGLGGVARRLGAAAPAATPAAAPAVAPVNNAMVANEQPGHDVDHEEVLAGLRAAWKAAFEAYAAFDRPTAEAVLNRAQADAAAKARRVALVGGAQSSAVRHTKGKGGYRRVGRARPAARKRPRQLGPDPETPALSFCVPPVPRPFSPPPPLAPLALLSPVLPSRQSQPQPAAPQTTQQAEPSGTPHQTKPPSAPDGKLSNLAPAAAAAATPGAVTSAVVGPGGATVVVRDAIVVGSARGPSPVALGARMSDSELRVFVAAGQPINPPSRRAPPTRLAVRTAGVASGWTPNRPTDRPA